MNLDILKDIIDEIICEEIRRKNPFKVGDLVKLRPDILSIYHNGPDYNARSFYKRLEQLQDKMGKVTGLSLRGLHVTVEFEEPWDDKDEYGRDYKGMKSIGIKFTDLVPYTEPLAEGVLGMLNPTGVGTIARQLIARFNNGQLDRNNLTKGMEELMWRSRTQDPNNFAMLKATVDKLKTPAAQHPGIRLKFEGVGWGSTKDMAKDPKHIKGDRWRIKFQSASDLSKHGNTEKSPVKKKAKETIDSNGIRDVIQELLKEMWIGWEESKETEGETDTTTKFKHYLDIAKAAGNNSETFKLASKKAQDIIDKVLSNRPTKKKVTEVEIPGRSYIIMGKSGPVSTFYVDSTSTQPAKMMTNAYSMAAQFHSEEEVRKKISELKLKYKGITHWTFLPVPTGSEDNLRPRPQHTISRPVKVGEEYVVKWMTDGKRDENKTYYTDDKEDALSTYAMMVRHAEEMNKSKS